ncbi:MAG: hypothetical protein RLW61_00170 [Gammaproteobacteria bacterium]
MAISGTPARPARRPCVLDIEASGFGAASYPIEVGVVLDDDRRWCSLIVPQPDWTHWSAEAEALHGISRARLQASGRPVGEVARTLNELLAGRTVYSDGWVVDDRWLRRLFFAAAIEPAFHLSPLEAVLTEVQMAHWRDTRRRVAAELAVPRHRASSDAWVIQETWSRTRAASAA